MFFRPERYRLDFTQSQQWNRGAYLARGLGHCGPCHTPQNLLLAERSAQALSGGAYSDTVAPGKIRTWSAVNLSLASTGLGHWSIEDIRRCLKTGHGPRAGMFGPMNNFIVNSLQYLSAEDALAIATYLKPATATGVCGTRSGCDEQRGWREGLRGPRREMSSKLSPRCVSQGPTVGRTRGCADCERGDRKSVV